MNVSLLQIFKLKLKTGSFNICLKGELFRCLTQAQKNCLPTNEFTNPPNKKYSSFIHFIVFENFTSYGELNVVLICPNFWPWKWTTALHSRRCKKKKKHPRFFLFGIYIPFSCFKIGRISIWISVTGVVLQDLFS